ncbi:hypothetical protein [Nocardioides sp.]|uniref:hypothetical protein n=1 Tax=Nocardioides sp. TaxID=35761 RepID=UPI0025E5C31D|nr:hypothetical protein [Nocardioides sp.]
MSDHEIEPAVERDIEPEIAEAVENVRNRYGVHGLEDLIALAEAELPAAREALAALEELTPDPE